VELTDERWEHILNPEDGHPELEPYRDDVLRAVREPDARSIGRQSNEEWFFLRAAGPRRWLQVVVAYEQDRGWIVTAFGRRRDP
jgi:hypothetical protein